MDNHTYIRLINKEYPLPSGFIPANLVDSGIPFDAPADDEKRLLEERAAQAALSLLSRSPSGGLKPVWHLRIPLLFTAKAAFHRKPICCASRNKRTSKRTRSGSFLSLH